MHSLPQFRKGGPVQGSTDAVRRYQQYLNEMTGSKLKIDGVWQNQTQAAYEQLQRQMAQSAGSLVENNSPAVSWSDADRDQRWNTHRNLGEAQRMFNDIDTMAEPQRPYLSETLPEPAPSRYPSRPGQVTSFSTDWQTPSIPDYSHLFGEDPMGAFSENEIATQDAIGRRDLYRANFGNAASISPTSHQMPQRPQFNSGEDELLRGNQYHQWKQNQSAGDGYAEIEDIPLTGNQYYKWKQQQQAGSSPATENEEPNWTGNQYYKWKQQQDSRKRDEALIRLHGRDFYQNRRKQISPGQQSFDKGDLSNWSILDETAEFAFGGPTPAYVPAPVPSFFNRGVASDATSVHVNPYISDEELRRRQSQALSAQARRSTIGPKRNSISSNYREVLDRQQERKAANSRINERQELVNNAAGVLGALPGIGHLVDAGALVANGVVDYLQDELPEFAADNAGQIAFPLVGRGLRKLGVLKNVENAVEDYADVTWDNLQKANHTHASYETPSWAVNGPGKTFQYEDVPLQAPGIGEIFSGSPVRMKTADGVPLFTNEEPELIKRLSGIRDEQKAYSKRSKLYNERLDKSWDQIDNKSGLSLDDMKRSIRGLRVNTGDVGVASKLSRQGMSDDDIAAYMATHIPENPTGGTTKGVGLYTSNGMTTGQTYAMRDGHVFAVSNGNSKATSIPEYLREGFNLDDQITLTDAERNLYQEMTGKAYPHSGPAKGYSSLQGDDGLKADNAMREILKGRGYTYSYHQKPTGVSHKVLFDNAENPQLLQKLDGSRTYEDWWTGDKTSGFFDPSVMQSMTVAPDDWLSSNVLNQAKKSLKNHKASAEDRLKEEVKKTGILTGKSSLKGSRLSRMKTPVKEFDQGGVYNPSLFIGPTAGLIGGFVENMGNRQQDALNRRMMGSTDFQYQPSSPASQYGDYLTNPGIAQNFRPNLGWAQNPGSGAQLFV